MLTSRASLSIYLPAFLGTEFRCPCRAISKCIKLCFTASRVCSQAARPIAMRARVIFCSCARSRHRPGRHRVAVRAVILMVRSEATEPTCDFPAHMPAFAACASLASFAAAHATRLAHLAFAPPHSALLAAQS